MAAVLVRNADRMMTEVNPVEEGIEVAFADGCKGLIPFTAIPEVGSLANLAEIELPNPYEMVLRSSREETVALPWDFARHYCDASYQPRVATIAAADREVIGSRIRRLREAANITQEALAEAAGIGRVTLVRIEHGEQSPRYETLAALARALSRPMADLLTDEPAA